MALPPVSSSHRTDTTVKNRSIDFDVLVRRVAGPEPHKIPVYYFSQGKVKTENKDHNPFSS